MTDTPAPRPAPLPVTILIMVLFTVVACGDVGRDADGALHGGPGAGTTSDARPAVGANP